MSKKVRGFGILLVIVLVAGALIAGKIGVGKSAPSYTPKQASDGFVKTVTPVLQSKSLFVTGTRCVVAINGKPKPPTVKTGTEFACIVSVHSVTSLRECDYVVFTFDGSKPSIINGQKIAARYCS